MTDAAREIAALETLKDHMSRIAHDRRPDALRRERAASFGLYPDDTMPSVVRRVCERVEGGSDVMAAIVVEANLARGRAGL